MNKYTVGAKFPTKNYGTVTIIERLPKRRLKIRFDNTGHETECSTASLTQKSVKDPMCPSVHGVGFIGEGKYKATKNSRPTTFYTIWAGMIRRCYALKSLTEKPTYTDCTVHPDWHNFQVFAEWCEENYIPNYHLDKDLKIAGNKIYAPDTCMFVPLALNVLLTNCDKPKGAYLLGVSMGKEKQKFIASISINGIYGFLGYFDDEHAAHKAYCEAKNRDIDSKCEKYPEFSQYLIQHKY